MKSDLVLFIRVRALPDAARTPSKTDDYAAEVQLVELTAALTGGK